MTNDNRELLVGSLAAHRVEECLREDGKKYLDTLFVWQFTEQGHAHWDAIAMGKTLMTVTDRDYILTLYNEHKKGLTTP